MTQFSDFALGETILRAVAAQGHTIPTPIQAQAINPILAGRDLCGIAQTGTGKTAAFALPILSRLAGAKPSRIPGRPRVLVLTPTRELASQVAASFDNYGKGLRLATTVIFGGVGQRPQVEALRRGVDVVVATPGRLLDLIDQRHCNLGGVEVLVVDEADQMLDLGFIVPLRKIVKMVPAQRQTLFFSATMPKTISDLAAQLLTDPVHVAVTPIATTAERVTQSVMFVSTAQKPALLRKVLADPDMQRVLVFSRTKHGADKVVRQLEQAGVDAAAIHGNKSQAQREKALASFKAGRTRVLVATDIAARGIHVESVSHVVNYDLPNVPESYVHRIGRTARAGAEGIAISFCNGEERAFLRDIEKLTRTSVPVAALPEGVDSGGVEALAEAPAKRRGRGGRNGRSGGAPREAQGQGARKQGDGGRRQGNPQRDGERHADGRKAEGGERKAEGRNRGRKGGNGGGQRQERRETQRPGGLDQASGLPAFLMRKGRADAHAE